MPLIVSFLSCLLLFSLLTYLIPLLFFFYPCSAPFSFLPLPLLVENFYCTSAVWSRDLVHTTLYSTFTSVSLPRLSLILSTQLLILTPIFNIERANLPSSRWQVLSVSLTPPMAQRPKGLPMPQPVIILPSVHKGPLSNP